MSKFVDSVFSFLGRRTSKDPGPEPPVRKRASGGRKNVLKADSFVFLPGDCTSNGTCLWGEVITPRTVGVPVSSYSDDYSVLSGGRKNVRSVLVDGSGKILGRRLSGSFVAKAVKGRKNLDEVEDGSLEAFLKEFEEAGELEERYHTYDRADTRSADPPRDTPDDPRYIYDRLIHLPLRLPAPTSPQEKPLRGEERERASQLVLDLRDSRRRRASSGGSSEHYCVPAEQGTGGERRGSGAVDWEGLRHQLEMAAVRGTGYS
jgi:hypothetical protein